MEKLRTVDTAITSICLDPQSPPIPIVYFELSNGTKVYEPITDGPNFGEASVKAVNKLVNTLHEMGIE